MKIYKNIGFTTLVTLFTLLTLFSLEDNFYYRPLQSRNCELILVNFRVFVSFIQLLLLQFWCYFQLDMTLSFSSTLLCFLYSISISNLTSISYLEPLQHSFRFVCRYLALLSSILTYIHISVLYPIYYCLICFFCLNDTRGTILFLHINICLHSFL